MCTSLLNCISLVQCQDIALHLSIGLYELMLTSDWSLYNCICLLFRSINTMIWNLAFGIHPQHAKFYTQTHLVRRIRKDDNFKHIKTICWSLLPTTFYTSTTCFTYRHRTAPQISTYRVGKRLQHWKCDTLECYACLVDLIDLEY